MTPPPDQEFGIVEALELRRVARRGSMQPLLCRANDGAQYILKPFSGGGCWPLALEWMCARLGRAVGLPIPNYRKIIVAPELAAEWNAFNERRVEPGVGFGSQHVPNALDFELSLTPSIPEPLRLRVLAFDWWIRNRDRGEKNPNLLWSADSRTLHVIDHDQACQQETAELFWGIHLFKSVGHESAEWFPPQLASEFGAALAGLQPNPLFGEIPPEWTIEPQSLDWFIRQLQRSLNDTPHRDWRNYD